MSGKKYSAVWDYFKKSGDKLGECKYCHKLFSYKTSSTNLKQHLKLKHKHAYKEMLSLSITEPKRAKRSLSPEYIEQEEGGSGKFSSEIERRFELDEEEARCSLCQEAVAPTIEDMKSHLEDHHPTVLDDIIAKAQKSLESDSETEENLYTEVVYLEDEPKRKTARRKDRSSVYYSPKPAERAEKQDDLEVFLNYVRSLLKKVPKEHTAKLQLDIINLIVNAQNSPVLENHSQNGGSSRVITLPDNVVLPNLYINSSGAITTSSNSNTVSSEGINR